MNKLKHLPAKALLPFGLSLLLIGTVWLTSPIYLFFAHKGAMPMPFWGYIEVPTTAPAQQQIHNPAYTEAANNALQALEQHRSTLASPGISAAVAIDGDLVWAGTAGWADLKTRRPVTPDTRFRIGSTSKPVTMTALARLVDQGRIDLDAPISTYIPNLPNPRWAEITPRQLASHMSGIPDYKKTREWQGLYRVIALNKHYSDVFDALEVFDQSPLLAKPGERFQYSSYNTVLLSSVIQAVAQLDFLEVIQQQVFTPLAMQNTLSDRDENSHMATFYHSQGSKVRPWRRVDLSHRLAGGGFVSTPSDLVRLGSAWLNPGFISAQTQALFWQPQQLNSGETNGQNYALGWRKHVGDDHIATNFNHGGVSRGAQCWLMVLPQSRIVIAISINSVEEEFWDFAKVSRDIANLFAGDS
ncbi:serine hydrolase domain-containing protein [Gilvimarinus sp. SDUM040013]|uniref:Serine hydrolase domain-containing protein n=1 Tax=Gilvimarinus gilvus TaxID=3058038 RepID=A0ABU4RYV5_9GAMM|nr:serine hydrolase domain-containing protein [Gilvimarinus sp. SDUM040013]MDO3386937.1 serine hydrolase domain-containing protein [Gilvimarinus sp. SDUM040013]MDX6848169.1 serine hydrolase domain-containing protein [Gilvimarinus sp. SDUM040013]